MPDPIESSDTTFRSPFVARLTIDALTDALVESLRSAGVVLSPATDRALQSLRGEIAGRMRGIPIAPVLVSAPESASAPSSPARANDADGTRVLLAELSGLIVRLDGLLDRFTALARSGGPASGITLRPPLPFDGSER